MRWAVLLFALPGSAWPQFLDALSRPILPEAQRRSMMYAFVDRNLPEIPLPEDLESWRHRRAELRSRILGIVGLPDLDRRDPVRWQSKGSLDRDGYTIEKIVYESYPGMLVPALVYAPKGLNAPAPAMVSIPGHNYCEGKASLGVQARAVNLVRRGVIVLAYDYIGTFERNTGANPCGGLPYGGGNDHGHKQFAYFDGTPTGLEILDGVRAIDYLCERRDVDRSRIGFTGESGGGNSTYWVAALDERVRLAVPVASVTSFDYWIRNDRNWDWHQRPPGIRGVADIWTLLAMAAPRPLLVITSLRGSDSHEFPYEEAERAAALAAQVYSLYGAGTSVRFWESSTSHGYQQDKREQLYGWVERHFFGREPGLSAELPFLFEPQSQLRCGLPPDNKTLAAVYREWSEVRRRSPRPLEELLGLPKTPRKPVLEVRGVQNHGAITIRSLVLTSAAGIDLPAVEFSPPGARGAVVLLGKQPEAGTAIAALVERRMRVVVMDPRGAGEIESGGGRTDNWAWLMGRPWPGMWVEDIRAMVTALGGARIGLAGADRFGNAALFAAALDPRIAAVLARLPEPSFRREMEKGTRADVPGILSVLDLPDLAAWVAPRACRVEPAKELADWKEIAAWFELLL